MSSVWGLIVFLLVVSCYHIPIKILFKYEKVGNADELVIKNWVFHPALGISLRFSVLELEELKSPEYLIEALLHVARSQLGIDREDDTQEVPPIPSRERGKNERLLRRVARKYHTLIQVVLGFLQREPQKIPAVHVGSFVKDVFVGTMLRLTPRCKVFKWDTDIGVGEASDTAIVVGIAWSLSSLVVAGISRHVAFADTRPSIRINPRFNQITLDTSLFCIFESRLGHIMIAGFRTLLGIITAYTRGGEQHG